ncbi:PAS domain S-box protein [Brevundimonas staleyi]|uniref:histidine kinase n=1 Tax=Brevundimonas staleyi TaxID=74326 RepID=A0ABW0FSK0_9CAUL
MARLRESEARYRQLFTAMEEGYLVADVLFDPAGKAVDIEYVEANPAAIRMVGADLTGRRLREVSADYEDYWFEIWGRVAVSGQPEQAERWAAPEGRWYEFNVFKLEPENADSRRVAVVFRDATQRRVAETALRESEERQAFVLELSDALRPLTDPFAIQHTAMKLLAERLDVMRAGYLDAQPDQDTMIMAAHFDRGAPSTPESVRLSDYGPARAAGFRAGNTQVLHDAFAESEPEEHRNAHRAIDVGAWIIAPLIKNGRLRAIVGVVNETPRDWTPMEVDLVSDIAARTWEAAERAHAEAALRESEARFRAIAEQTEAGVATADREGRLIWVNDRLAEIVVRQPDDAMRLSIQDYTHPDDWAENERLFRRMIEDGVPFVLEKRLGHPDGGTRWNRVSVSPRRDASGRVVGGIAVAIDISDRKQAEETLRESEERMRLAIAATGLGTFDWDLATDRVVVNARFREIVGLPAGGEVIASAMMDGVVHPDDRDWVDARIAAAMDPASSGAYEFEHRAATPHGVRWLLTSGQVYFVGEGDRRRAVRIVGNDLDITERKKAEARLRESEERQTFLLKLSDALRPLADPEDIQHTAMRLLGEQLRLSRAQYYTADETGEYLSSTGGYTDGVPAAVGSFRLIEFGKYAYDGFHAGETQVVSDARTDPRISEAVLKSYETVGFLAFIGVPFVQRGRFLGTVAVHQAGPRQWTESERIMVEETAQRAGAAMEQVRAETALRESEARFQQFAAASSGGLWIRSAETLKMEYVSPAIGTIYGVAPDDLFDGLEAWARHIVPEDRDIALEHIHRARQGEAVVHEFRIQRPSDRSFRWIRDTDFPLFDDQGRVQRIGGIAEDVTDARLAVEHQGVLLAELQHRVRNIMAMLRSVTARTADGARSVEDYRTLMIGRLMALARTQTLLTRSANTGVEIGELIREELLAQAGHEGQYDLIGPEVVISPKAAEVLSLAVHELATNALKYGALARSDGTVTVRWTVAQPNGQPLLRLDWSEQRSPPADWSPPTRSGFGSQLIEQRVPYELGGRGKIEVRPEGARAWIEFPLRSGDSILETDAPLRTSVFGGSMDMTGEPSLSGLTVLVLEDEFYLAQDVSSALRGAGAEVLGPFPTEAAALTAIGDRRPDAAVLDINLGSGPSFEVARVLRGDIAVLFLTGYDAEAIPAEFAEVPRLQKPIELREVVRSLARMSAPSS